MTNSKYYLWGDSIGKGVVYDPEHGRYRLTPERCERIVAAQGVWVTSYARFGQTVRMGYEEFRAEEAGSMEPGGTALIQYGGNDCDLDWQAVSESPGVFHDGKTPLPEFGLLLRRFAQEARLRELRPVLVLPPPLYSARYFEWVSRGRDREAILRYLGDVEHIGRWHALYVEAIREAAADTGSPVLDFYTPFLRAMNFPELMCLDGIHPSAAGQKLMAKAALETLGRRTESGIRKAPQTAALRVFA